jgi:hypothetical protein
MDMSEMVSLISVLKHSTLLLFTSASAYPDLCLPAKMSELIEEGVAAVEKLVGIVRAEAMRLPLDSAKCRNISIAGYRSLQKGKFVADDAIDLVLVALTHVLGGRFVCKDGRYSEGPVSPQIRWNRPSKACRSISELCETGGNICCKQESARKGG